MEYSLDNKNYSTNIPKGQDAKQYEVYYRVKGDENHSDRDPVQIFVTINPKTVSSPVITLSATSFIYNGEEQRPDVTVKDGEVLVYENTLHGNAGMAVGGSGDVLTGIILALMAQHYTAEQAAVIGVWRAFDVSAGGVGGVARARQGG